MKELKFKLLLIGAFILMVPYLFILGLLRTLSIAIESVYRWWLGLTMLAKGFSP
jgi:VIT1/CCC1 family predicted Fe2+/Mn2+ transporter